MGALKPGPDAAPLSRSARGFTLVELLVAFAMVALVLAVVPVALGKASESAQYRSTVRQLITDLRAARNHSVMSGRVTAFKVDLVEGTFGLPAALRPIPQGLELEAVFAAAEIEAPGRGHIRFFPDGSSTGGSISVTRKPAGGGVRLRVDWMLGRVTQEALDVPG